MPYEIAKNLLDVLHNETIALKIGLTHRRNIEIKMINPRDDKLLERSETILRSVALIIGL